MPRSHKSTVGIELELSLIYEDGFLANEAPLILQDTRNDGSFVYENSNARIEVISAPAETVTDLHLDFLPRLALLEDIRSQYGIYPVPVSEFNAGAGTQKESPRLDVYSSIIGDEGTAQIRSIAGFHTHFSQFPGRELAQYWLLTALDPISFSITSTSPISYKGKSKVNCHRIKLIREKVSARMPLHGHLLEYPGTLSEIETRKNDRFEEWLKLSRLPRPDFEALFTPCNTGFCPVRKRDNIGPTGTLEARGFDTCPLENCLAAVALFKGINDRIVYGEIPVEVAVNDSFYYFGLERVVLPNFTTLKGLEREAIYHGVRSPEVKRYLQTLLRFAEPGLPSGDRRYLATVKEMLRTGVNPADRMISHLRRFGNEARYLSPQDAAEANLYMRSEYLRNLRWMGYADEELVA